MPSAAEVNAGSCPVPSARTGLVLTDLSFCDSLNAVRHRVSDLGRPGLGGCRQHPILSRFWRPETGNLHVAGPGGSQGGPARLSRSSLWASGASAAQGLRCLPRPSALRAGLSPCPNFPLFVRTPATRDEGHPDDLFPI